MLSSKVFFASNHVESIRLPRTKSYMKDGLHMINIGTKADKHSRRIDISEVYVGSVDLEQTSMMETIGNNFWSYFKSGYDNSEKMLFHMMNEEPKLDGIIRGNKKGDKDMVKVNSILTRAVNRSTIPYDVVLKTVFAISEALWKELPFWMKKGDIYIYLKGGCAWGLSLLHEAKENGIRVDRDKVDKEFRMGDNDVGIQINPKLDKKLFDRIYNNVVNIVDKVMRGHESRYAVGGDLWDVIESSINWADIDHQIQIRDKDLHIKSIDVIHNQIVREKKQHVSYIGFSRNDTLSFWNGSTYANFTLMRYKLYFLGGYAAELLDVAIPRQDDSTLYDGFNRHMSESAPFCDTKHAELYYK